MRPGHRPRGPTGRPGQRRGDRLESGVALGVGLVAVVGRLEAVDVGHDQGDRAAVPVVRGQRLVEPLLDEAPVAEARSAESEYASRRTRSLCSTWPSPAETRPANATPKSRSWEANGSAAPPRLTNSSPQTAPSSEHRHGQRRCADPWPRSRARASGDAVRVGRRQHPRARPRPSPRAAGSRPAGTSRRRARASSQSASAPALTSVRTRPRSGSSRLTDAASAPKANRASGGRDAGDLGLRPGGRRASGPAGRELPSRSTASVTAGPGPGRRALEGSARGRDRRADLVGVDLDEPAAALVVARAGHQVGGPAGRREDRELGGVDAGVVGEHDHGAAVDGVRGRRVVAAGRRPARRRSPARRRPRAGRGDTGSRRSHAHQAGRPGRDVGDPPARRRRRAGPRRRRRPRAGRGRPAPRCGRGSRRTSSRIRTGSTTPRGAHPATVVAGRAADVGEPDGRVAREAAAGDDRAP